MPEFYILVAMVLAMALRSSDKSKHKKHNYRVQQKHGLHCDDFFSVTHSVESE